MTCHDWESLDKIPNHYEYKRWRCTKCGAITPDIFSPEGIPPDPNMKVPIDDEDAELAEIDADWHPDLFDCDGVIVGRIMES